MNISLGRIKKDLLISKNKTTEIAYFEDLVFYYRLNNFIPEIEINENLEIIKRDKFYEISKAIATIKYLNVVVYENVTSDLFSHLIEKGDYSRRNLNKILEEDRKRKAVKNWQCYKFSEVMHSGNLHQFKSEIIAFYNNLNEHNKIDNFNYNVESQTVYFTLDLKLHDNKLDYYFEYRAFLTKISSDYHPILLINGLLYEYYFNPNLNLFEK